MTETLRHRGPDDGDVWQDVPSGVTLGHRRLAILDLSPSGSQPMTSASGRWTLVYNGEIYNYRSLAADLRARGVRFAGTSDSEVLLEAICAWGVETAIGKCNGMFAFAAWDRARRELWLARDRLGEKPLYYFQSKGRVLFASELKALHASAGFHPRLERDALALYLRYGRVPGPMSIFSATRQLEPGSLIRFSAADPAAPVQPQRYWSAAEMAELGVVEQGRVPASDELVDETHERLKAAVAMRMRADVPLGAFLSGGIDSSLVVALMQSVGASGVRTFSVGFDDVDYDESAYARAVARHLGSQHREIRLNMDDGLHLVPRLSEIYDEPFADSSQIPTLLVSEVARREVTVCLSGDGGDEVFGGYNHYRFGDRLHQRLRQMPAALAVSLQSLARLVPYRLRAAAVRSIVSTVPRGRRLANPERKFERLLAVMDVRSRAELYFRLIRGFGAHGVSAAEAHAVRAWFEHSSAWPRIADFAPWMMAMDTMTYLPDDILTKVDRASMAVSLETRIPLLDHTLVEFAWSLPASLKLESGGGKWVLRKLLQRYLPQALIDRPKMGFAVPLDRWLRGPLRVWAQDLFASPALACDGLVDAAAARKVLADHLSGRQNQPHMLWTLLMLLSWRDRWQV